MNPKDIRRLMELNSKAENTRTEAEKAEIVALNAKMAELESSEEMSAADVREAVSTAVKSALAANPGLKPEDVKTVVDAAIAKIPAAAVIDQKSIVDAVVAAMPKTISADDVKALLTTALKDVRRGSKMEFPEDGADISLPITHRSGNLSVSAKQLLNVMTKKDIDTDIPADLLKRANEGGERAAKRLIDTISREGVIGTKNITAGGAGSGLELMNFSLSSILLQRLYLDSLLAQAMIAREIQMPTNPFTLPLSTTRPVFQANIAEGAGPASTNNGTAATVLNASKLMGLVPYSDEADEDSIIAILPMITNQLGQAAADALENALINGDTTGTMDTGIAANDSSLLFDGIRKLTLAQANLKTSLAAGGISAANIAALRKSLGKWGLKPADLLLVVGTNAYNDAVLLPETLTAEKAGSSSAARILTGVVPQIFGIDIIPSAQIRENLNASGVFDNVTTTKGSVLLLHKPSWIQGVRRGFTIEPWRNPTIGLNYVVASFRRAFKPLESLANTRAAAIGINYNS